MAESKVKIRIGSEADLGAFGKLKNALASAASKVKSWAKGIGSNLMNIKAGFDMLKGALSSIGGLFKKALDAESMTVQFKTLMGSMDEARQHMETLRELGSTPPFSLEQFAEASRAMMALSDGALGMRSSLELVGDAAAATGKPIEQVGEAVAKAYAMIRDGQPVSKVANSLRNLGLITPEVAASLKDMQDSGASGVEIWDKLQESLGKFKGAMEETEETGNGMIGAIQSQWDEGVRDFGESLLDVGKVYIKEFLDWLKKIREDGSLKEFIDNFAGFTKIVLSGVEKCVSAFKTFKGWLVEAFSTAGDVIGAMAGGASFDEAVDWAGKQMDQREEEKKYDEELKAQEKVRQAEKQAAKEREKEAEREAEKRRARDEIARKDAERKAAEKAAAEKAAAEKAAKEKAAAEAKAAEEAKKKKAEQIKNSAEAEKRAEQAAHDRKMKNLDAEIKKTEEFQKLYDQTMQNGMEADRQRGAGWGGGGYQYTVDANGNPNNVADEERARRFAESGTEQKNKAARREATDERRHQRILDDWAKGRKLSSSDQRFLESRERMLNRRAADKKIEELQQQKDRAVLDLKNIVQRIETNMDTQLKALGVK